MSVPRCSQSLRDVASAMDAVRCSRDTASHGSSWCIYSRARCCFVRRAEVDLHYWARQEILVPSVSPERVKLWSYGDLMALRTIY